LRNLSWSLRRIIFFGFAAVLYGRCRRGRRRGLGFDRGRWSNLQVVYYLLHPWFTRRIASGRVALGVRVHLAGKGHASLIRLHDELLTLESGIGAQFALDIGGNLGVRRSLGAANRGQQNTKQNGCNEV
jgi:hypothetical protein